MPPKKDKHKKQRWLDIACGMDSSLGVYQYADEADIVGIDVNPQVVEQMKTKYPNVSFAVADAHCLPFPKETFDRIFCTHVLEHVEDPVKVLQETNRVLKPDGEICIAVPHPHYERVIKHTYPTYHSKQFHQRVIAQDELLKLVKNASLAPTIVKTRRWFYAVALTVWFALGRLLGRPLKPEGLMYHKGSISDKTTRLGSKERVFRGPRQIADMADSIPILGFFNRIYPFETYLVVKKSWNNSP